MWRLNSNFYIIGLYKQAWSYCRKHWVFSIVCVQLSWPVTGTNYLPYSINDVGGKRMHTRDILQCCKYDFKSKNNTNGDYSEQLFAGRNTQHKSFLRRCIYKIKKANRQIVFVWFALKPVKASSNKKSKLSKYIYIK